MKLKEKFIIVYRSNSNTVSVIKDNLVDAMATSKTLMTSVLQDVNTYMMLKAMISKNTAEQEKVMKQLQESNVSREYNEESECYIFYLPEKEI